MKFLRSLGLVLGCLCFMVLAAHAGQLEVQPETAKNHLDPLLNENKKDADHELIVRFADGVSSAVRKEVLQQVHGKESSFLKEGNFAVVSVPAGEDVPNASRQLMKNALVVSAEPNYQLKRYLIPQDPGYKKQWYLSKIGMPKAWDLTKGSAGIIVAVIDDGANQSHSELKGRMTKAYNAVNPGHAYTAHDHATHVAGIIAAALNKSGIAGIAPNVKIMSINVFNGDKASTDVVAKAIKYAVDHDADVINLSLGTTEYSHLMDYYVNYAKSRGAVLVAAAGNSHTAETIYPAAFPEVIGVSATDQKDRFTYFSNYGKDIDVAAPGMDIYSITRGKGYASMSGTSMAAPVVSGVAALIRSKNPMLSPDQVEAILKKSTQDLGKKGKDSYYGYGRVNAYKAVLNTPKQKLTISAPAVFSITGTNKAAVSVADSGGKSISVYVKDPHGKLLKYLIKNQPRKGSRLKVYWDGKTGSGKLAASGSYKITVKVSNGKDNFYKSAAVKVVRSH